MGSRTNGAYQHSRTGSLGTHLPPAEERILLFTSSGGSSESENGSENSDLLLKMDDLMDDPRHTLIDLSGAGDEIRLKFDSPESKLDHRILHSRQASSSSVASADFKSSKSYLEERHKTLLAGTFMVACVFCTTLALATVHDRRPDGPPLPDVVFSLVPSWDFGLNVSEYLIIVCVYPIVALALFHRYRWIVFRRIFLIIGVLYLGRAVTMLVTAVPVANPLYFCAPKENITSPGLILSRAWSLLTGFGMSINGKHVYCGDYIYSGHTCMLVLSYLLYNEYLPRKGPIAKAVRLFFLACSTAGVILVTISRGHYTVDVLIAYAVTTVVFYIYHTVATFPQLKSFTPNNHLSRLWWFRLVLYFEVNVPDGKLPVRYSYPFPFPKRYTSWKLDYLE
ncbi:putative Phosphatidylcholine:ceramide cholinephosphotransferase 1 [Hypsibius exemplaris]|uniref:Phosphatidylcholine:ceramide cholinephosphotransferase 1 n=1 Tax=Hypsibius exemplaris TaxID=2072580 RepID=A0A1W0X1Y0_HYPEX|nr:putative Phosphatidylcholine:ceramide cholinephosphotransferase 1 [Hypsibius exemplaris]